MWVQRIIIYGEGCEWKTYRRSSPNTGRRLICSVVSVGSRWANCKPGCSVLQNGKRNMQNLYTSIQKLQQRLDRNNIASIVIGDVVVEAV